MIIDLTVEDDNGVTIRREDGLVAAFEVNNFQAGGAEGADFGAEDALLVWAAMNEGRRGAPDAVWIGRPIFMCETGDAAQILKLLSVWVPVNRNGSLAHRPYYRRGGAVTGRPLQIQRQRAGETPALLSTEENKCDADADEENAEPTSARHAFAEENLAAQRSGGVAQGCDGHDE